MLNSFIQYTADLTNNDFKEIELTFMLVIMIFLGFFYKHIPLANPPKVSLLKLKRSYLRQLYGLFGGFLCVFKMLTFLELFFLLISILCYFFVLLKIDKQKDPKIKFYYTLIGFLLHTIVSLYVMIFCYGVYYPTHLSMITMLVCPKIIFYVWQDENERCVFDYLSYVFFFPGSIVGPSPTYMEYKNYINSENKDLYKATPWDYIKNVLLFLLGFMSVVFGPLFIDYNLITTSKFQDLNILYKLIYIYFFTLTKRTKYMVGWSLSHMNCLSSGIKSCDGDQVTDKPIINIDYYLVETSLSSKNRINNWNIGIAKWLKECSYLKLIEHFGLKKSVATNLTFFWSAFWHGFYPSYYISFFFWQFITLGERSLYKISKKLDTYFPVKILNVVYFYLLNIPGTIFLHIYIGETMNVFYNLKWFTAFIVLMWFVLSYLEKLWTPKTDKKSK